VHTEAYGPREVRALSKASADFLHNPPDGFSDIPLQHAMGLSFVATEEQKADLYATLPVVQELNPNIHEIGLDEVSRMCPVVAIDKLAAAFYDPDTIGLDVNAIHQGYLRGHKSHAGKLACKAGVTGMQRENGQWIVETKTGQFSAAVVVNASGAWADDVARMAGAREIGIVPKRRTCIIFDAPEGVNPKSWPAIIDMHENYYFKEDAGKIVASLGDETPDRPHDVQPDDYDVAVMVDRLENATTMSIDRLVQQWAGLRSFVDDRLPVVGYAPDTEGFFWCAGQGGYGIATSYALGKAAANLAVGGQFDDDLLALDVTPAHLAPERLWD
jgi:D-arginine dehydrogenase